MKRTPTPPPLAVKAKAAATPGDTWRRDILMVLHSINCMGWLVLGTLLIYLGDDGTPMETGGELWGLWIILAAIVGKISIGCYWVRRLFS